ncbi:MAG: MoxR family ATPase [Pseudomonadota bacterium]|nr:MoxR family ATPase [Pseudomonadota bacterium]
MHTSFAGTARYIADDGLMADVNAAILLGRPLLVKGEPGTGKTVLAAAVAEALGLPLYTWTIKSTTKAVDGLYNYDVVQRLNDARFGEGDVKDIRRYIRMGVLGQAFCAEQRVVVLIDEIDKADLEFPNDMLRELDEMAFHVPELDETVRAKHRPIVIITSNAEKELPDAFLRRCVFHYIAFPDRERMRKIVDVHLPDLSEKLIESAFQRFYGLRRLDGIRKKPSTSELVDWLSVLARSGVAPEEISAKFLFPGILLKQEQDLELSKARR